MPYTHSMLLLTLITLLVGCERYAFTLNEQPIYTPNSVYSGYRIGDPALASCVKQALVDSKITQPEQLQVLNCSYAGVTQLKGIETFSRLRSVNLSHNQLTDIKPLLFLGDLRQVNLEENPNISCSDVEALANLLERADIEAPICSTAI